jgi:hypothetical protein
MIPVVYTVGIEEVMMSSLFMGGFSVMMVYLYILVPLTPLVYLFVKWKSYRESLPNDPQLGLKTVLFYFKVLGYHVSLVGLAIAAAGLVTPRPGGMVMQGIGVGLAGLIVYGAHAFLIHRFTNTKAFPLTQRAYNVFNVIITGLAGMVALIYTFTVLFESGGRGIAVPLMFLLVYGGAWAAQTYFLLKWSGQPAED